MAKTGGGAPSVKDSAVNCQYDVGSRISADCANILDGAGGAELRVGEVTGEPPGEKRMEVDGVVDTSVFLDDSPLKVGAMC